MQNTALIVSHGTPSDPDSAETALSALAAQVQALLPHWQIASATLAKPGALEAAVAGHPNGLVYPMFIAGGWFPKVELPRRMALAGASNWQYLNPFGLDPDVQALALRMAQAATPDPSQTAVLVAAHGSSRSTAPAEVAQTLAQSLRAAGFARVEAYFIDQSPQISTAQGFGQNSLCLPFFIAEGGHVLDDLPAALTEANFTGTVLPPLGLAPEVPQLIAAALSQRALR